VAELDSLNDRLIRLASLGQHDAPDIEPFGGISGELLTGFETGVERSFQRPRPEAP